MKRQQTQNTEQRPPIPLSHVPRRIRRNMARAQMREQGLHHINKQDVRTGKSYFARTWRNWVLGVPKGRKAG